MKHTVWLAVIVAAAAAVLMMPVSAQERNVDHDELFCFSATDFTTAEQDDGIFITAVPSSTVASIRYGSRVLRAGDALPLHALNDLTLEPVCIDQRTAAIQYYTVSDGAVTASKELKFSIMPAENKPPVAENSSFETYKNIANTGSLKASDPEGKPLTYELVKEPKRGTVELYEDGTFLYTPNKNKVGKDSFTFTVTDSAGNTSEPAKVSVQILKPSDKQTYADMTGDPRAFYAMWMKEEGLYTGATVGGNFCFSPDTSITRGDFLVMAMHLVGAEAEPAQMTSGFADEGATPVWLRPYIVTALSNGMIRGATTEAGVVFRPEDPLTKGETMVLLQNILRLPDADTAAVFSDLQSSVPTWAETAAASVAASGITVTASGENDTLTRADAACILYEIHERMEEKSLPTFFWTE